MICKVGETMQKSYYAIIPATVRYDKKLTDGAKLLYGEITALCNEKGYCWASDSYFSELYKVSKSTIQRWFKQLEDNKYIKRSVIYEEGTLKIKHRYTYLCDDPIPKNETTPIRKNEGENNTVINNTNNSPYTDDFETFWKEYPRKIDKKKAFRSFKTAIKNHSLDIILSGTKGYAQYLEKEKTDKKFIKHASTFLNNDSFLDFVIREEEKPKKAEPTKEESETMRIRELKSIVRLGRDYYSMTNEEHIYDDAVKELEKFG